MKMLRSVVAGVVVLYLSGELDKAMAEHVALRMEEDIATRKYRFLLDLGGIRSVDAGGIDALVQLKREMAKHGAEIRLACPSAEVCIAMGDSRVERLFTVYNDVRAGADAYS